MSLPNTAADQPTPTPVAGWTTAIRRAAEAEGFDLVGVTPAITPAGFSHLVNWIAQGHHGTMDYIPRRLDAYRDPERVLPGARSVIALALNYHADHRTAATERTSRASHSSLPAPESPSATALTAPPLPLASAVEGGSPVGRVARYALPSVDYHNVIRGRLRRLVRQLTKLVPQAKARGVVDTAPILERDFARAAGLGWFGKNTLLIHKQLGSWLFLAAVLVDIELEYDPPHVASHCGTCTRCLAACPTGAFPEPYVLDARRCISYHTIESRELPPEELRTGMQDWLFGCDLCQEVCPWNRRAPLTKDADFQPNGDLTGLDSRLFLTLSPEQFEERFGKTPLARPGWWGMRRNALVVLGNTGTQADIPLLSPLAADPTLQPLADWAINAIRQRTQTVEVLK